MLSFELLLVLESAEGVFVLNLSSQRVRESVDIHTITSYCAHGGTGLPGAVRDWTISSISASLALTVVAWCRM
jgi:hypothetical protein